MFPIFKKKCFQLESQWISCENLAGREVPVREDLLSQWWRCGVGTMDILVDGAREANCPTMHKTVLHNKESPCPKCQ